MQAPHLGGVDHEGDAARFWVGHKQVDKAGHGSNALYQPVIHVDVQDIRTLLHLQERRETLHLVNSCRAAHLNFRSTGAAVGKAWRFRSMEEAMPSSSNAICGQSNYCSFAGGGPTCLVAMLAALS